MNAKSTLENVMEHGEDCDRVEAAALLLEDAQARHTRRYNAVLHVMWMALIAAIACCAMCCAPRAYVRSIPEEHGSAVEIKAACSELPKPITVGSGVVISEHEVLTAAHVVHPHVTLVDAQGNETGKAAMHCSFFVEFHDMTAWPVAVNREWEERDVALLYSLEGLPSVPITIGETPRAGERVCIVSAFPAELRRCGETQWYGLKAPGHVLVTGVIIEPGNSGSGVYDTSGRLVGLAVSLRMCGNGQWCEGAITTLEFLR